MDLLRDIEGQLAAHRVLDCPIRHVGTKVLGADDETPSIAEKCPKCGAATWWLFYRIAPPPEGWAEWRAGLR
jgi:hypothetical protein